MVTVGGRSGLPLLNRSRELGDFRLELVFFVHDCIGADDVGEGA